MQRIVTKALAGTPGFECIALSADEVIRAVTSLGLRVVSVVPQSPAFVAQWRVDAGSGHLFTFVRLDATPRVWVGRGHLSLWEEVRQRAAAHR